MFNNCVHYGYRKLTESEIESAKKAIAWLAGKRLKPHEIALLTDKDIDREGKLIAFYAERGKFAFLRRIKYEGSEFDLYITEVLPKLLVQRWIFPSTAWNGRKPSFGFHVRDEAVEKFLKKRKQVLFSTKKYNKIIISTKKSNLYTIQTTVGRRIALRAET